GSAVAVEHIFSAASDILSLCCASLKPDTIQILMLYKQHISQLVSLYNNYYVL
ncbi:hypothetical protein BDN71DRAFT_1403998, partial [Pleurotus eryngii]